MYPAIQKTIEDAFVAQYEALGEVDAARLCEAMCGRPGASVDFAAFDAAAISAAAALGVAAFQREGLRYRIPPAGDLYEPASVTAEDTVYRVGEFKRLCETGAIRSFSGHFLPAVDGVKDMGYCFPVSAWGGLPQWATHVVWVAWADFGICIDPGLSASSE